MAVGEGVLIAARVLTGSAFLIVGVRNIANHGLIAGMFGANGIPFPKLLTGIGIAMQIGFGALMVSGVYPAVAALGLLVFTLVATLMAHSFWTVADKAARSAEANAFLANMVVAGGLLALAAAGLD